MKGIGRSGRGSKRGLVTSTLYLSVERLTMRRIPAVHRLKGILGGGSLALQKEVAASLLLAGPVKIHVGTSKFHQRGKGEK